MFRLVRLCAAVSIAVGLTVVLAWLFDIDGPKSLVPGWATMKLPTAMMFVVAGIGLLLTAGNSLACRRCVMLAGSATLATGGWFLAIGTEYPGWHWLAPSAATSLSLSLIGLALILRSTSSQSGQPWATLTAFVGATPPFIALASYALGPISLYSAPPFSSMAVHTAATATVLAVGIVLSERSQGLVELIASGNLAGQLIRRMLPLTLLLPVLLAFLAEGGVSRELFDPRFGLVVLAGTLSLVTSIALWGFARRLDRVDGARRAAVSGLEAANTTLAQRVAAATADLRMTNEALTEQIEATGRAQAEFEALFELAPDAMLLVGADGRLRRVNSQACLLFGYSREEFMGLGIEDLMPAEFRGVHRGHRSDYSRDPRPRMMSANRVLPGLRRDGAIFHTEISLSPTLVDGEPNTIATVRDVSAALRANEQLALNEARWRNTMLYAPTGVALNSLDGRFIEVNEALCEILRSPREELLQCRWQDISYPEDLEANSALVAQVVSGEIKTFRIEKRCLRRDGSEVWTLLGVSLLRDPLGAPLHLIAQVVDISSLKATQKALTESELRLQRVIEGSDDGFWDWNIGSGEVRYSDRWAAMLGYRAEELAPHIDTWLRLTHPDDLPLCREALADHFSGRSERYAIEHRMQHRDGHWLWILERGKVYERSPDGRATRIAGTYSDISERHSAQEAIRDRERTLQAVLDALPVGVWLADPEGKIVSVNRAGQEIWGGSKLARLEDYGEHKGWRADSGEPIAPREWALARAVEKGETVLNELIEIECSDGSRKFVLDSALPIRDEAGRPRGALMVKQDMTAWRRMEQDLRDRGRQLENSNKELERFAYVASHDLQEPLRKVSSFVELFASRYAGAVDETADAYIRFIVDGARRMQTLIDDLLAYSRVTRGEREFAPVDLGQSLSEALTDLELAIRESGVRITAAPLPTVLGDAGMLRVLFQNLVGNAIKYRGPREPTIEVGCRNEGQGHLLWVRDNGIGIDPRYFERIFVIFQRLHTRSEYPGTGIGLAICKRIVERHGGRIWVDSEPDAGTTFYFTLPAAPDSRPPARDDK